MKYLYSTGKYHLAELAAYASPEDQRHHGIPWEFYPAAISPNDERTSKASISG